MHPKERWGKRGNFALMAILSLGLVIGFAALVIDIGHLRWTQNRAMNAAEAAALAAVKKLDYTPTGLTNACNEAATLVSANSLSSNEFAFRASCTSTNASTNEIRFGIWDSANQTFTESREPLAINAVKVNVVRSAAKQNAVAPLVAGIFSLFGSGTPSGFDVSGSAVAIVTPGNPPAQANIFPIAASECGLKRISGAIACGREVILGDAPSLLPIFNCPNNPLDCVVDSSGNHFNWTSGTDEHGGTSDFRNMTNALVTCLTGGSCSSSIEIKLDDTIHLHGGNHAGTFNSNQSTFPDYLEDHGTVDVQVPLFRPSSCSNDDTGDEVKVTGFATLRINKIVFTGSKKYVRGVVICDATVQQPGSASSANFGTLTPGPGAIVK